MQVKILSGVFEGQSTGTPIQLMIENTDQRSKDYGDICTRLSVPVHADITYHGRNTAFSDLSRRWAVLGS